MARLKQAMTSLRATPIDSLAGLKVDCFEDYYKGTAVYAAAAAEKRLELPKADMVRVVFEGCAYVIVRPSGTEPKLKLYVGVNAEKSSQADELLESFAAEAKSLLDRLLA